MEELNKKEKTEKDAGWIVRRILLVIYDIAAVNLSYFSAILLRFYMKNSFQWIAEEVYLPIWVRFTPWYTLACIVIFLLFGLYKSRLRAAGLHDLYRIVVANLVTAAVQIGGSILFIAGVSDLANRMPVTYYFIGAVLQLFLITISRFSFRIYDTVRIWSRGGQAGRQYDDCRER